MSQLQRDILLAQKIKEVTDLYNNLIQNVGTLKGLADENKRQLAKVLNLPKGDKGDRGEMGPRGKPGTNGKDGKDGYTPVKGVDYFTLKEKEELYNATLAKIKQPKDGKDAIVDEEKLAKAVAELIRDKRVLGIDHIGGLREEVSSYRHQMAMKQAGQHGGGDTVVAGSGISITSNANGTKTITATASGGSVTQMQDSDTNGVAITWTDPTTTPQATVVLGAITPSSVNISGLTASEIVITDGSKNLVSAAVATYPSLTELTYLKGVTSAIQTQLNAKMTNPMTTGGDLIYGGASGTPTRLANGTAGQVLTSNGTTLAPTWEDAAGGGNVSNTGTPLNNQIAVWTNATTIEGDADLTFDTATNTLATGILQSSSLTASEIVITDGSKNLVSAAVATYPSLTELTYLKGVTSAIQTQLNAKQATITFGTGVEAALGVNVGTAGSIVVNGGALGTPSSGTVTNLTGTASININGTVGATTPTTATFTTATINTSLLPDADDGAVLGAAATGFSDLFLASGAVIGFANGNVVLTHSSGILTVSTGDLRVTTAGTNTASVVTVGGTQTLTGKTLTSPTIGGTALLAEGGSIGLDPTLSADGTYTGVTITGTAGTTLAFGDWVYLAASDSRWELTDADAASTAGSVLVGVCVQAAASDGSATTILLQGNIRADTAFPSFTVSAPIYLSTTPGDVTNTAPSATDDVVRVVGFGLTADSMVVNVSPDYITIV